MTTDDSLFLSGPAGEAAPPLLRAVDVRKAFGRHEVLNGINMEVNVGEVVCILGPSGSGKSTFLRCINHLETADYGRIWFKGQLIGYQQERGGLRKLRERDLCRQRMQIGMVFQNFNLFGHKTAIENVIEGPIRARHERRDVAVSRGLELLDRVGLRAKADLYPRQLSGGQQQRVAIARALAMEPDLLLFDEPTSALDPELVDEVLSVIKGLAAGGMTMIIVTHEVAFAASVADRVVFTDAGVIVEQGPAREVLENPQHARTRDFLSRVL